MDQDENGRPAPEEMARELLALMPGHHAVRAVEAMRAHMWREMIPAHLTVEVRVHDALRLVAEADAWLQRVGDLVAKG